MNPVISIIIPVYNAEKYLKKCIDSVLNQTFTNFEILLINDGSSDDSGVVCDKYAQKDSRVLVFHQENRGPSAARNLGLDNVKAEWICFVDSDDWVKENYLNNLIISIEPDVDLVIGGFTQRSNTTIKTQTLTEANLIVSSRNKELVLNKFALFNYSYPVAKLFRSEIISENLIRFHTKMIMFEDTIFLMEYLKHSDFFKLINSKDYQYILNEGSISFRLHSFEAEYVVAEKLLDISINDFNLNAKDLKNKYSKLGKRISNSTNRAILSMLRSPEHSKIEVLEKFKLIDKKCIELYSYFYTPNNYFRKVIKFFVVNKFYALCYYYSKIMYKISYLTFSGKM